MVLQDKLGNTLTSIAKNKIEILVGDLIHHKYTDSFTELPKEEFLVVTEIGIAKLKKPNGDGDEKVETIKCYNVVKMFYIELIKGFVERKACFAPQTARGPQDFNWKPYEIHRGGL